MTVHLLFNPLSVSGPAFLFIYILIIAASWLFLKYYVKKKIDSGLQTDHYMLPRQPDPYEAAYLRGGVNEVIKLGVYRVLKFGYNVNASPDSKQVSIEEQPSLKQNAAQFNAIEKSVYQRAQENSGNLDAVLRSKSLRNDVSYHCYSYINSLEQKKLLWSKNDKTKLRNAKVLTAVFLCTLASAKIIYAIAAGHYNIIFLILLAIAGTVIIFTTIKIPVRSTAGDDYINRLQSSYNSDTTRVSGMEPGLEFLMAGIFGMAVLQGTGMGFMHPFTNDRLSGASMSGSNWGNCSSSSSCSSYSSCSSSSSDSGGDGGSSCGGGCGGCGGGGD